MLGDVLDAVEQACEVTCILVVSSDLEVREAVRSRGHSLLSSPAASLNMEVARATRNAERQGSKAAVVVMADLPLLTGQVLDTLIREGNLYAPLVVAGDWRGTGTNILYLRPPTLLQPQFGPDSLREHLEAAREVGLLCIHFTSLETALDLDDEEAVSRFFSVVEICPRIRLTRTYRELSILYGHKPVWKKKRAYTINPVSSPSKVSEP